MPPIATPARPGGTNAADIATARRGGVHDTLQEFLDDVVVDAPIYSEAYQVTPANADFILISTALITGQLSVGVLTEQGNGELHVAELAGAVGAADVSVSGFLQDSKGRYGNVSEVRDAATHDPLVDFNDRAVYAAWQCANGTADGAAIGAPAAENVQVTFFIFDDAGVAVASAVDQEVQLGKVAVWNPKHEPRYRVRGGKGPDVVGAADAIVELQRAFIVTNDFAANEVFDLGTGAGAAAGTSDIDIAPYNESMELPATAAELLSDDNYQLLFNGKDVRKTAITWHSTTTFSVDWPLNVGDVVWWKHKVPSGAVPVVPTVHVMTITTTAAFNGAVENIDLSADGPNYTRSGDLTTRLGPDDPSTQANVVFVQTLPNASGVTWGFDTVWIDANTVQRPGSAGFVFSWTITSPYSA